MFSWLQRLGDIDPDEMLRVFNMGIGLVLIVSHYYADAIGRILLDQQLDSWQIGEVVAGSGKVHVQAG